MEGDLSMHQSMPHFMPQFMPKFMHSAKPGLTASVSLPVVLGTLALAASAGVAQPINYANGPTPIVPPAVDILGEPFQGPGAWPNRVSAAHWRISHQTTRALELSLLAFGDGPWFNYIDARVNGGPLPQTTVFVNHGDNDLNLSPRDPSAVEAFPGVFWDAFREPAAADTQAQAGGPFEGEGSLSVTNGGMPNYAWMPSAYLGTMLTSVAANGTAEPYAFLGGALPPLKAIAQASITRGGGSGYDMISGEFSFDGGGPGAIFVSTNFAIPAPAPEIAIDQATAWFPYAEGWCGAWYAANQPTAAFESEDLNGDGAADIFAAAPGLPVESASWTTFELSEGRVELPGKTPADGMLFMYSPDNSETFFGSTGQIEANDSAKNIGVIPDATGWNFTLRYSTGVDASGLGDRPIAVPPSAAPIDRVTRNAFAFNYVPYDACNLVGGHINGSNGATIRGAGQYSVTRLQAGVYAISIPGESGAAGRDPQAATGVLMFQVADSMPSNPSLPDRTMIDYSYNPAFPGGGAFIVQVFELVTAANALGFTYNVRDTDFYFMWVDFENPVQAGPCDDACPADFNGDTTPGDIFDLFDFLAALDGGLDFNGDTSPADIFDLFDFLAVLDAGCP